MNLFKLLKIHFHYLSIVLFITITFDASAQHGHINAGVIWSFDSTTSTWSSTNKLGFKNANDFAYDFIANAGYTLNLPATSVGGIATHYGGTAYHSAWTPTSLRGTSNRRFSSLNSSNVPNYLAWETYSPTSNGTLPVAGASQGSYIRMSLVSIERLSGSATSFSIWDNYQTSIIGEWGFSGPGFGVLQSGTNTFNLTAHNTRIGPGGSTAFPDPPLPAASTYPGGWSSAALAAGFRWNVPNPSNIADVIDPFGHIHGRNFATNNLGEFRLVWQLSDANGIHTDSDLFTMRFMSIPEPMAGALLVVGGALLCLMRFKAKNSKR